MTSLNGDLQPPRLSTLNESLKCIKSNDQDPVHATYLHTLASTILHDLEYQHYWTSLTIHTHSPLTRSPLPRPIISGLPPRRVYVHPDEQAEIIRVEHETGEPVPQQLEREWVLPTQIQEKWSLAKFVELFDSIESTPPNNGEAIVENPVTAKWHGKNRKTRLLLATLHDDSTVVYYIMHEGLVKPRQN